MLNVFFFFLAESRLKSFSEHVEYVELFARCIRSTTSVMVNRDLIKVASFY
jgi:hypothetical protein